jgi:hypothetical protein
MAGRTDEVGSVSGSYQPTTGSDLPKHPPRGGSSGQKPDAIRYLGDVQKLTLGPNDAVVLSVDEEISDSIAERLREMMQAKLPGRTVIVLGKGMKIGVLAGISFADAMCEYQARHL